MQTLTKDSPSVTHSHSTHSGCLRSTFGNFSPKANTLVRRLNRGVYRVGNRPRSATPMDHRGPVVRTVGMAQAFLTPAEVDQLVGDYEAGSGVQELAKRYGIHRATVFAHLQRREVPRRRPGLSDHEQAEAVRLSRDGMSMRAIGRQMGVDREAVRRALVEAGLIEPNLTRHRAGRNTGTHLLSAVIWARSSLPLNKERR